MWSFTLAQKNIRRGMGVRPGEQGVKQLVLLLLSIEWEINIQSWTM
jgi:hypothetical protein